MWDCDLFLAMVVSGISSASECDESVTDSRVMITVASYPKIG